MNKHEQKLEVRRSLLASPCYAKAALFCLLSRAQLLHNEKVYALLCVGFVRLENSVYTVLPVCGWIVGEPVAIF